MSRLELQCNIECQVQHDEELDTKHQYEDEANESDNDFIDDSEPDESNSSAADMARTTIRSFRNRETWQQLRDTHCPLCNDMRTVLRSLLQMD